MPLTEGELNGSLFLSGEGVLAAIDDATAGLSDEHGPSTPTTVLDVGAPNCCHSL